MASKWRLWTAARLVAIRLKLIPFDRDALWRLAQTLLGHKSVDTTRSRYEGPLRELLAEHTLDELVADRGGPAITDAKIQAILAEATNDELG